MTTLLAWFALALLIITSTGILLSRDWRWSLAFLGMLYVGVFLLVRLYWPLGMSAAKLVTGWMAGAVLGMTRLGISVNPDPADERLPQGRPFRLLTAALAGIIISAAAPGLTEIIPGIGLPASAASLTLISMGLLNLGITSQPLPVSLGLLMILAGFEILYAAVEGSVLVAGLLAAVSLGLALTGAYLLTATESGQPE